LTYLRGNWLLIVVMTLLFAIGWQHTLYQNVEQELGDTLNQKVVEIEGQLYLNKKLIKENDEFKAKLEKSDKMIGVLEHNLRRVNVGCSINLRLPIKPYPSAESSCTYPTHAASEGIMAFDGGLLSSFARDCAYDAARLLEFQSLCKEYGCKVVP